MLLCRRNADPVKWFLSTLLPFHLKEFFSSFFFVFLLLRIDDHGSFVICRATSVRPDHLSDQNFDHDYYFKLLSPISPNSPQGPAPQSGRESVTSLLTSD